MKYALAAALFIGLINGCTTVPVSTPSGTQTSVSTSSGTQSGTGWQYNDLVASKLTPAMLKASPGDLCPKLPYATVEFWEALTYATVKAESDFNPNEDYTEKFAADNGKPQTSSGMLQISLDDKAKGTPVCKTLSAANIHDPATNIGCGVEMMGVFVGEFSGTLRQRLAHYWSTIGSGKTDATMKAIMPSCFI